ncbi:DUF1761 domain-containing protein [Candidatus Zixiibacteriota bacterium]
MDYGQVNFLAVFVASFAGFAVGPLWYGPLFGKKWMELTGITAEDAQGGNVAPYIVTYIGFFFLAYAIARIMSFGHMSGAWWGVITAVFVWFLVMAPLMLSQTLYHMKPVKLWAIDSAFRGVSTLIIGLIIGIWS